MAGRRSPTDDDWPEQPMRILRTRPDPTAADDRHAADLRQRRPHWWDGSQIYGSDAALRAGASARGEGGKLRLDRTDCCPLDPRRRRPHRRRRQLVARPEPAAHPLHARAQRHLRPPAQGVPDLVGRRAVRPRAAGQRGADGQDPHRRVDAGDPRPPDDAVRHARQLVGPPRRAARQALRPNRERGAQRHPRLADRTTTACRTRSPRSSSPSTACTRCCPDDFTFRSLEDDAVLEERTFPEIGALETRAPAGRDRARRTRSIRSASRIPGAITLHNFPRFLQHFDRAGRDDHRPGRDRRPAHPRARRAALQRVPRLFHLKPVAHVRGADRQPGVGRGAAARLRRRRARRPDGRHVRRAAAEGLRLQRHRLPHLHPDGLAAAEERPLLHPRLHAPRSTRRPGWTGSTRRTMSDVLLRHFPELEPALRGVTNAFAPWKQREPA